MGITYMKRGSSFLSGLLYSSPAGQRAPQIHWKQPETPPGNETGTDEDTERLIKWRSDNEELFTGRRNAAQKGFDKEFIVTKSTVPILSYLECSSRTNALRAKWRQDGPKKWENLKQKYKELKAPRTGVSTEGGETTAATWKWFQVMDEVMGQRPSITPPNLITSAMACEPVAAAVSPPEEGRRKRRREDDLLEFMREMEEREEDRERKAEDREERRERERRAEEREERREREREWREWMESRAREERREREAREAASAAREERLLSILEHLIPK
ncbi:uncharacterized protein V6R79_019415 [Siganus canaliculatus]